MRHIVLVAFLALSLVACESRQFKKDVVQGQIDSELKQASQARAKPAQPEAVSQALLPPITVEMPKTMAVVEPRFDLVVNNAPANQVFMALVSGTRYSMLVHPDITETISVNLKNVTMTEALESIREIYGYEYKTQGTRIYVQPVTIQMRLFQVNYLAGRRIGRADVRVTSGSIQTPPSNAPQLPMGTGAVATAPVASGTSMPQSIESSRVTTTSDNDFWVDLDGALRTILGIDGCRNVNNNTGAAPGAAPTPGQSAAPSGRCDSTRSVVVNSQAGVVMVRAMPAELRTVEQYLNAMSIIVERQVMLEAKIIDVSLSDQYSTGINWAAFKGNFAGGVVQPGTTLTNSGGVQAFTATAPDGTPLQNSTITAFPGTVAALASGSNVPASVFGLAFQSSTFASLLNFLESQGTVHVLSSPRIATLNNQKAVIKVGTDEFFVTNITTTTTTSGVGAATVSPTITTQPFFSGIALDVTPQISDEDEITLHIHPSVSLVTDKTKTINLGTLGVFTLPLASSNINESDTIVRVQNGTIAAIGGLMKQQQLNANSGLPGTTDSGFLGNVFGSRNRQLNKSELVILLKVTVIKGDALWQQQAQEVNERMQNLRRPDPSQGKPPAQGK